MTEVRAPRSILALALPDFFSALHSRGEQPNLTILAPEFTAAEVGRAIEKYLSRGLDPHQIQQLEDEPGGPLQARPPLLLLLPLLRVLREEEEAGGEEDAGEALLGRLRQDEEEEEGGEGGGDRELGGGEGRGGEGGQGLPRGAGDHLQLLHQPPLHGARPRPQAVLFLSRLNPESSCASTPLQDALQDGVHYTLLVKMGTDGQSGRGSFSCC